MGRLYEMHPRIGIMNRSRRREEAERPHSNGVRLVTSAATKARFMEMAGRPGQTPSRFMLPKKRRRLYDGSFRLPSAWHDRLQSQVRGL